MVTRPTPYILAYLVAVSALPTVAQSMTPTETTVSGHNVRTLHTTNPDNFMTPAVIRLGSNDRLHINFDIIGDTHHYLRYRLIHCNADWQPSRLLESEYLEGFNESDVNDYAYSSNTFVHYVNYNIELPNPDMKPLASGNYLLQVYSDDNPDDILLQSRFSVSENIAVIKGVATPRTDRGFNTEWQQIDLEIDLEGLPAANPYQDLIVTVAQNNRPETTRTVIHPQRVEGKKAFFQHNPDLIFGAGNEYRRFETVRIDNPGMNVDSVVFGGTNWHAFVSADRPRKDRQYIYDRTQHGRFMVDEYNASDPNLGADYVTVHFSLEMPRLLGMEVYVDGDFSLHSFEESNRMTYDSHYGAYRAEIPLKQGSYNYQYVAKTADNTGLPDAALIEGNFYETSNEYLVNVYFKPPGSRYDRLIGSLLIE